MPASPASAAMTVPTRPNVQRMLEHARSIAARSMDKPAKVRPERMEKAAIDARTAASMLRFVTPSLSATDLRTARRHAHTGAEALDAAAWAWSQELPIDAAMANVKRHAAHAFKEFGSALDLVSAR